MTDPRPAATEAAIRETVETIINESVWHEYGGDEDDELFIGAIVRERIELAGITFAAAPPSGQVVVDREDAELVMDAAIEYVSEQRARLPNMILDQERNETAVYVASVDQALDRFSAVLADAEAE